MYIPFSSKQAPHPLPVDLQVTSFDKTFSQSNMRTSFSKLNERASTASLHAQGSGLNNSNICYQDAKVVINEALYEEVHMDMTYVFQCLCTAFPNEQQSNLLNMKMMDTILFETDFKPKRWIFTDLLGRIQFKDIN